MSTIAVIGAREVVEGFSLAGVVVHSARTPDEARQAFSNLDTDTSVVFLTEQTAAALTDLLPSRRDVIWTTLPT
ncbi:MAG: V-type ATP synthase subunit F [Acidobacteria bacterium]|nr:V-type ATP synthase subunit F [Acidobacteriota bacterium]